MREETARAANVFVLLENVRFPCSNCKCVYSRILVFNMCICPSNGRVRPSRTHGVQLHISILRAIRHVLGDFLRSSGARVASWCGYSYPG